MALRSRFLPLVVVALGVLAALPFRRTPRAEVNEPTTASTLPTTVTPLRERKKPSASRWMDPEQLSFGFAAAGSVDSNPYRPEIDALPESYDELAVPLALEDGPPNLFQSPSGTTLVPDRFGIPRSRGAAAGETLAAAAQHHAGQQHAGQHYSGQHYPGQWLPPAEVPVLSPLGGGAAIAQHGPPSVPAAEPQLAEPALSGPPTGVFRVTGRLTERAAVARVTEPRPAAEPSPADIDRSQDAAPSDAPPRRLFIREPRQTSDAAASLRTSL